MQQKLACGPTSKLQSTYLCPNTQNEFIDVLGTHVKSALVAKIKEAKYFEMIFGRSPYSSRVDQMSEIIRYVSIANRKVEVKEVFLGFFELKGKKADDLSQEILKQLKKDGLDINLCRGQGYDNASVMSGIYGGVQQKIKEVNPKALFNGCASHSLNLCGTHSFSVTPDCMTCFGTLESMYVFFSASTGRWDTLMLLVDISLKRIVETRWSATHEAVKPVAKNYDQYVEAIHTLCQPDQNFETKSGAQVLLPTVCDFSFLCYLYCWAAILEEVDHAQQYLQYKGLTLDKVVAKLDALKLFLSEERERVVDSAIEKAEMKADEYGITVDKPKRCKKKMPREEARDEPLSNKYKLRRGDARMCRLLLYGALYSV